MDINDKSLKVVREIDGGLETVSTKLPAVITTDLRYVFLFTYAHKKRLIVLFIV